MRAKLEGVVSSIRRSSIINLAIAFLLSVPLLAPLVELARNPSALAALLETPRIASLLGNTLGLAVGAVLLAVPAGIALAVFVEYRRVPERRLLVGFPVLGAVIPLSVMAAGWQAVFGVVGLPDIGGWRPWRLGLLPAIWVHGVAGIPWVAGFAVLALRSSDRDLEADASLAGGNRAVWLGVLWPRLRLAAFAGACWVIAQAFTDSTATDLFMVRTFAEEVYFQLVGNPAGVAAAVAVTLPAWIASNVLAVFVLRRIANKRVETLAACREFSGFGGRFGAAVAWFGLLVLAAVPLVGLLVRTGSAFQFLQVAKAHGFTLVSSVLWSAVAGLLAAIISFLACWQARQSRRWAGFLLVLTAVAWVTPAPLLGFGLKSVIAWLVALEDAILGSDAAFAPLRTMLYDQPSPIPGVWVAVLRFFSLAAAVMWVAVSRIPRELIDAARLEGGERAVWRAVVWPGVRVAFAACVAAVGLLSLGEVVATKLVQPPGWRSFSGDLFDAMHYGADATVAAMCLLQAAVTALLVLVLFARSRG